MRPSRKHVDHESEDKRATATMTFFRTPRAQVRMADLQADWSEPFKTQEDMLLAVEELVSCAKSLKGENVLNLTVPGSMADTVTEVTHAIVDIDPDIQVFAKMNQNETLSVGVYAPVTQEHREWQTVSYKKGGDPNVPWDQLSFKEAIRRLVVDTQQLQMKTRDAQPIRIRIPVELCERMDGLVDMMMPDLPRVRHCVAPSPPRGPMDREGDKMYGFMAAPASEPWVPE